MLEVPFNVHSHSCSQSSESTQFQCWLSSKCVWKVSVNYSSSGLWKILGEMGCVSPSSVYSPTLCHKGNRLKNCAATTAVSSTCTPPRMILLKCTSASVFPKIHFKEQFLMLQTLFPSVSALFSQQTVKLMKLYPRQNTSAVKCIVTKPHWIKWTIRGSFTNIIHNIIF